MNKFFVFLSALLITTGAFANINFAVDYAIFQAPEEKPYVEFYLSVNGSSIAYAQKENQLYQANIELTYIVQKGEKVISFEKFQLNSPEYSETDLKLDLLDLRRLPLDSGEFTYTVIAKDIITGFSAEVTDQLRPVNLLKEKIQLSEIQLSNQLTASQGDGIFVKNGYDMIPNVSHAYGKSKNKLICYFEIYNADKTFGNEGAYLLDIKINDHLTGKTTANLRALKRMSANTVTPIIQNFDLSKLPSGDYDLIVEIRNKKNEPVTKQQTSFLRSNPSLKDLSVVAIEGTFVDSMRDARLLSEHIKSLRPISSETEKIWADNQLKYAELEFMQRYFLNFWKERNKLDPEFAWIEYKEKVEFVDQKFGYGNVNGYSTERGRVYLQYGAPNTVQNVKYDSDNHPYAVWQYYKLKGLTDRKFIFYSPSNEMLGYEVLHSNVPGEVRNDDWEYSINKKVLTKRPGNTENGNTNFQRRAQDLFDNPDSTFSFLTFAA